jgi:hypothetical protein
LQAAVHPVCMPFECGHNTKVIKNGRVQTGSDALQLIHAFGQHAGNVIDPLLHMLFAGSYGAGQLAKGELDGAEVAANAVVQFLGDAAAFLVDDVKQVSGELFELEF